MPRTILCALDGTPKVSLCCRWASAFSQQMAATLKLIHVAARISEALALPSEAEIQEEVNQQARAKIESLKASAGVEAALQITLGSVAEAVADAAEQQGVNLSS